MVAATGQATVVVQDSGLEQLLGHLEHPHFAIGVTILVEGGAQAVGVDGVVAATVRLAMPPQAVVD